MSTSVIVVSVSSCVMWRAVDKDVHKKHTLCALAKGWCLRLLGVNQSWKRNAGS
jgi:hypothetical protein